jgi:aminodeoxychorismate synthase component I
MPPLALLSEEFDYRVPPEDVLPWLRDRGGLIFLDSAGGAADVARYSWLMAAPSFVVTGGHGRTSISRQVANAVERADFACDPLQFCEVVLEAAAREAGSARADEAMLPLAGGASANGSLMPAASGAAEDDSTLPFAGGFCGYAGYDYGAALAGVLARQPAPFVIPSFHFGWYDLVLAWDHRDHRAWITVRTSRPEWKSLLQGGRALEEGGIASPRFVATRTDDMFADAGRALAACARGDEQLVRRGNAGPARGGKQPPKGERGGRDLHDPVTTSNFDRDSYINAVRQVRELILAGDIFQANISQRFSSPFRGDPLQLYLRLREGGKAPFSAFIDLGDAQILSASPELFLRVSPGGAVETRPIKGTRRRGDTDAEDRRLAAELLASEKDRSENLMIVDLLRNDLSRACEPGSVYVSKLCDLERLPTVQHLVSTVNGRLKHAATASMLLRCCFPGGSITGAPKGRAMEIISEIELSARGVYCGTIGFLDPGGGAEFSIAIRTVVIADQTAIYSVGGGLVLDSTPAAEYDETLAKAAGVMDALASC